MNVLRSHLRITIQTLLQKGKSQHEIARLTGVDRKTIRRYASEAKSPGVATGFDAGKNAVEATEIPPPWPPAPAPKQVRSACEAHREWIEEQVQLGRNAQSIYQDLVQNYGFTHRYNSVKRFVRTLKVREPERFDVLGLSDLVEIPLHLSGIRPSLPDCHKRIRRAKRVAQTPKTWN